MSTSTIPRAYSSPAGNYVIAVQNYAPAPAPSLETRKEAKRKADHAHNLRLQKARLLHHGKLKNPW